MSGYVKIILNPAERPIWYIIPTGSRIQDDPRSLRMVPLGGHQVRTSQPSTRPQPEANVYFFLVQCCLSLSVIRLSRRVKTRKAAREAGGNDLAYSGVIEAARAGRWQEVRSEAGASFG